mgnify:CR=1 FL=1
MVKELAEKQFKNDANAHKILLKHMGNDWKNKCETGLSLAKDLGNIYTGSLYNGLLSLVCDTSIDLTNRRVLMFSYGSGCAASLYVLRFNQDYKYIQKVAQYQDRLDKRVRIPAEIYD